MHWTSHEANCSVIHTFSIDTIQIELNSFGFAWRQLDSFGFLGGISFIRVRRSPCNFKRKSQKIFNFEAISIVVNIIKQMEFFMVNSLMSRHFTLTIWCFHFSKKKKKPNWYTTSICFPQSRRKTNQKMVSQGVFFQRNVTISFQ